MARKEHQHHYIYKTTCSITGKYYIGMHSTSNLEDGYVGSGRRLWLSINKHGKENHSVEILELLPDRRSLKLREREVVNEDLLNDPQCMNIVLGGGGGSGSLTTEQLRKGAITMNKKTWADPEFRRKKHIENSNRLTELHKAGKFKYNTFTGKSHSAETKRKIGESNKQYTGEKNSQYGTCWIYNNLLHKCIKISQMDLSLYLTKGWIKGRRMKF